MELMQLRYFQVVAMNQHITRSAEQLNVSQPAISTVISRLESELGVPLFYRSGRSIVLSEYGEVFLKRVNTVLMDLDNARRELEDMQGERDHQLAVSVTSPQFLQGIDGFIKTHPEIKWQQSVEELPEIIKLLENGKIDIAVTSPEIVREDMATDILYEDRFMIAAHPDHPLAKRERVRVEDILDEKFIALQKGLSFRTQMDQLCADLGIELNIIMESDHYLRRRLLNMNAGITISSMSAKFRHLYDPQIVFIPLDGVEKKRIIALTYRKDRYLSKDTKDFCQFLKNYYGGFR